MHDFLWGEHDSRQVSELAFMKDYDARRRVMLSLPLASSAPTADAPGRGAAARALHGDPDAEARRGLYLNIWLARIFIDTILSKYVPNQFGVPSVYIGQ
jgi:hypothetical protein